MSFLNKKIYKTTQLLFIFSFLISLTKCAEYTEKSMRASLVFGIGVGTFVLIIFLILGGLICIFGLSTTNPGLFLFIGILLPCLILLILTVIPTKKEKTSAGYDKTRSPFRIVRWVALVLFIVFLLIPIFPLLSIWMTQVIPQRVDSRAQKEYDMKYLRDIEEERKKEEEREEEEIPQSLNLNDNRTGLQFDLPAANVRNNENKKKYASLRRRRGNNNDNEEGN